MIRATLTLGLAAFLACSGARAATFTFADASGKPFCSVIRIEHSGGVAGGILDDKGCRLATTVRGSGIEGRFLGHPGRVVSFSYNQGRKTVLFLLDEKALTWSLYFAGPGNTTGLVPQEVNSGALLRGKIEARGDSSNLLAERLAE